MSCGESLAYKLLVERMVYCSIIETGIISADVKPWECIFLYDEK
jgi:hypothetical protein